MSCHRPLGTAILQRHQRQSDLTRETTALYYGIKDMTLGAITQPLMSPDESLRAHSIAAVTVPMLQRIEYASDSARDGVVPGELRFDG